MLRMATPIFLLKDSLTTMRKTTEHDEGIFEDIQSIIASNQRFLVSSHIHSDGDAIGAALAFKRMLELMGKDVRCVMEEDPGETFYRFYSPEDIEVLSPSSDFSDRDVIVMADAGEWHRLGKRLGAILENHPGKKICIDHHYPKNQFQGTRFLRVKSPSTTVIMYNLLRFLGLELTKEIAEAIYLGIIVDTINFHLPHTNEETHIIAADCLRVGVDPSYVYEPIYGTTSPGRLQLMCQAFSSIRILFGGKVASMQITRQMFQESGAAQNDDDGFVEFLRTVKGVSVGVYFRQENENEVKISWRAKGNNNVVVSAQRFNGGGHLRAAGATILGTMDEVRALVLGDMEERVKNGEIS